MNIILKKLRGQIFKPFRPGNLSLRNVFFRDLNLLILLNEDIGWRIFTKKEFEDSEFNVVNNLVKEHYTCVDVGGNIGLYSLKMAQKAPYGTTYSFDPLPLYTHIISINAFLNGIENIRINQIALSDKIGPVDFSVSEDGAYSSFLSTGRKKVIKKTKLETSTLDHYFYEKNIKIDFLKIDVEGAEFNVLKGGEKLLGDSQLKPKYIIVELNEENQHTYGIKPIDIINFLEKLSYDCYSIMGNSISKGWPLRNSSEDVLFIDRE